MRCLNSAAGDAAYLRFEPPSALSSRHAWLSQADASDKDQLLLKTDLRKWFSNILLSGAVVARDNTVMLITITPQKWTSHVEGLGQKFTNLRTKRRPLVCLFVYWLLRAHRHLRSYCTQVTRKNNNESTPLLYLYICIKPFLIRSHSGKENRLKDLTINWNCHKLSR